TSSATCSPDAATANANASRSRPGTPSRPANEEKHHPPARPATRSKSRKQRPCLRKCLNSPALQYRSTFYVRRAVPPPRPGEKPGLALFLQIGTRAGAGRGEGRGTGDRRRAACCGLGGPGRASSSWSCLLVIRG